MFRLNYNSVVTHAHYDAARDGQRFVSRWLRAPEARQRIRVVTDLLEELTSSSAEE